MKGNIKYLFISLTLILLIGIIHLSMPFFGDQAFFLLGAKEMDAGFVLYRDFWDIKQPGIFYFYLAGGKLFGFSEVGIHLFELIYWLGFFFVLIIFLQKNNLLQNGVLIYGAPLMIIGSYYSFGNSILLTQVEALANFPLLLTVIFNYNFIHKKNKAWWIFLSGISGGLLLFFKLIFLPVLLAIWVYTLASNVFSKKIQINLRYTLILITGIFVMWIPFILYCIYNNIVGLCFETFFKYPVYIVSNIHNTAFSFLIRSAFSFLKNLIFYLPLTCIFLFIRSKENIVIKFLLIWLVSSLIVIVLQRTSWYTYHFQILYTPIILLALFELDRIWHKLSLRVENLKIISVKIFSLFLLNLTLLFAFSQKIYNVYKSNFLFSEADRRSFILKDESNRKAFELSKFYWKDIKEKCKIFVINDPLIYYYTKTYQPTSISAWSFQLLLPNQIAILLKELQERKPCYILFDRSYKVTLKRGKKLHDWINKNYTIKEINDQGIWYVSK